jgi:ribonuclease P protein component
LRGLMLKKTVLRRKSDFTAIYGKGKSVGERYVVLFVKENGLSYNRVAFLASKKVGKSVVRNRARRLMKESYRGLRENVAEGFDIIFIARKTTADIKCADMKKSMETAIKRIGVLERKAEQVIF